jgi:tetratricopeptide (TPR) repeat protein
MGITYFYKGEAKKTIAVGKKLLEYGQQRLNIRSQAIGYYMMGYGQCVGGNFEESIELSEKAMETALDPFYSVLPNIVIGLCHLFNGRYIAAKNNFQEIISFGEERGFELMGVPAGAALAAVSIAEGQMTDGFRKIKEIQDKCLKYEYKGLWLIMEHMIGQIYVEMITGPKPNTKILIRNVGFLLKTIPFAAKRAEKHLQNAITVAQEIGADGIDGQAHLSLGLLYKAKKKNNQAKDCLLKSIKIFRRCGADGYKSQAQNVLESLN